MHLLVYDDWAITQIIDKNDGIAVTYAVLNNLVLWLGNVSVLFFLHFWLQWVGRSIAECVSHRVFGGPSSISKLFASDYTEKPLFY